MTSSSQLEAMRLILNDVISCDNYIFDFCQVQTRNYSGVCFGIGSTFLTEGPVSKVVRSSLIYAKPDTSRFDIAAVLERRRSVQYPVIAN